MSSRVQDALMAASYPLWGIWTVLRNPEYWQLLSEHLWPLCLTAIFVHPVLLRFAFVPQCRFLADHLCHGSAAWPNAAILTLAEGLALVQLLSGGFDIDMCRAKAFDATLIKLRHGHVVASSRMVHQNARDAVLALGATTKPIPSQPWDLLQICHAVTSLRGESMHWLGFQIATYLPLILIPYAGGPLFVVVAGHALGISLHDRWFQLRGVSDIDRRKQLQPLWWHHVWFGSVALTLELVPVLSHVFSMTNSVASAIWAADVGRIRQHR